MSELLHSVNSIFDEKNGFLAEHEKEYYNIPLYQRGYKWNEKQVTKLLDDINRFSPHGGKFYCVQNITLVPKEGCFNVVDGQQRLTTMTLILSRLGEKELVRNKVRFPNNSIREKTNEFINKFVVEDERSFLIDDDGYIGWERFVDENEGFDHQDIYFLYGAYDAIDEWFESNLKGEEEIETFRKKLLNDVKFITNYIDGENEERIFGNLNSKRIYLDGSDLVRAILITRVTNEESRRQSDIKDIVRVNERRVRIGWQLDETNKWWSSLEAQHYFGSWVFIEEAGDVRFNMDRYPINRLLALFMESEGRGELSLEELESFESAGTMYKGILNVHDTLRDWFEDKEIYHSLGFLFNQRKKKSFNFHGVWEKWTTDFEKRDEFKQYLRDEIKKEVFGSSEVDKVFDDSENWYEGDNKTLVQILLLLDIIEANKEYKDKLHGEAFTKSNNDIEHIFPQTPKEPEDDYKSYVDFLLKHDPDLSTNKLLLRFEKESENIDYIEKLGKFFEDYTKTISIHSIGNLVLLYSSLNRSISNRPYSYKRKRVLGHHNEGNYIQPHTLKVFARYFQDDESDGLDLERWTEKDIEANEAAIKTTLINFFKQ